ncbi:unnamed protein product [Lactuca virosa]|uniref:Amino acid transporter transmembrane domain-containing protein n=1 Tax=Lactuca virosa TaxID=75947 RepID=A0AAU9LRT6_9ASTR|nr:unnamed protein product [Lactuca virosa]
MFLKEKEVSRGEANSESCKVLVPRVWSSNVVCGRTGNNEDFLLIVLKDILPRRRDLTLILLSATLNAELFSNYFQEAPMIHIHGFTHPVRAHFLEDILEIIGYKLTSFNQIDDCGQEKLWKTQRHFGSCVVLYVVVAIMGYMMFGESKESQYTLNLPTNLIASKVAVWTTVVNPFTKYMLTISPVAMSLEELIPSNHMKSHVYSILIRTTLVFSTLLVALSIPFLFHLGRLRPTRKQLNLICFRLRKLERACKRKWIHLAMMLLQGSTFDHRWQLDSNFKSGQKDHSRRRLDAHQFDSNGSSVASQLSNMSNPNKIMKLLVCDCDRGRKAKALKSTLQTPVGQPGSGSPWSLFEDQALVVLVHDMGPNWELISDVINSTLQFKLFIDWLLDLSTLDPVFEGANFQVLTALATSFHALQPLKVPAFRLFS